MPKRCLNCPNKPVFADQAGLDDHWKATHTVPQTHTLAELGPVHPLIQQMFPDILRKTIKLVEDVEPA